VYLISDVIEHRKPIILRGETPQRTTLYFTRSLTDLKGNSWRNGVSDYAHSTGLLNIWGWDPMANPKKDLTVAKIDRVSLRCSHNYLSLPTARLCSEHRLLADVPLTPCT
jgi:hypothetical protein